MDSYLIIDPCLTLTQQKSKSSNEEKVSFKIFTKTNLFCVIYLKNSRKKLNNSFFLVLSHHILKTGLVLWIMIGNPDIICLNSAQKKEEACEKFVSLYASQNGELSNKRNVKKQKSYPGIICSSERQKYPSFPGWW